MAFKESPNGTRPDDRASFAPPMQREVAPGRPPMWPASPATPSRFTCGTLTDGAEGTLVRRSAAPVLASSSLLSAALPPTVFTSSEPWRETRIGAVAIYCSDGRWGDAIDEFCHRGLSIPAYDRFAVPGGPGWLTANPTTRVGLQSAARNQLGFLVEAHRLQRIVLITHWGCAYYGHALHCGPEQSLPTQLNDVATAADTLRAWFGPIRIEGYLAARETGAMTFHRLSV